MPGEVTALYALECRGAVKSFRESTRRSRRKKLIKAVDGISFVVPRGEIFGILGPNGSGKSTLIRLVSTLLVPDQGEVRVFGLDVNSNRLAVRRLINRVSVEAAFFKKLSAMENLRYAAGLYGLKRRDAEQEAVSILARLGVRGEKIYNPLENMSRGTQQKVAIARALLTQPVLVLLDEPTTGLDPKSKRDVQEFVLEVRETHDATVILTTHDMAEAEKLCDRVAIIDGGRFVALDTPEGLKRRVRREQGLGADQMVSMEDVFFALTGRGWSEDDEEEESEGGRKEGDGDGTDRREEPWQRQAGADDVQAGN